MFGVATVTSAHRVFVRTSTVCSWCRRRRCRRTNTARTLMVNVHHCTHARRYGLSVRRVRSDQSRLTTFSRRTHDNVCWICQNRMLSLERKSGRARVMHGVTYLVHCQHRSICSVGVLCLHSDTHGRAVCNRNDDRFGAFGVAGACAPSKGVVTPITIDAVSFCAAR